MKIKLLTSLNVGGKFRERGNVVEASINESKQLIARGYAEEADASDVVDVKEDEPETDAAASIDDMTGAELKQYLTDNDVDFKSSAKVDELKDLAKSIAQPQNEG